MNDRSNKVFELLNDFDARRSYIKATLGILVPSSIRALRLKSDMPRQSDLAAEARMQQSRISMFETPGEANVTLETLARLAAAFKVGLKVEFVSFNDMLRWENNYSQDTFDVTRIDEDVDFICPVTSAVAASEAVASATNQASDFEEDHWAEIATMNLSGVATAGAIASQAQAAGGL
jgi:transcriptional regulator with XRE-family HTH domain